MDAKTAARIEAIRHSLGWEDLTAEFDRQEELFWKRHVSAIKRGEGIDQRELDRALGKLDGIRAILRAPEKAAAIMLRAEKGDDS